MLDSRSIPFDDKNENRLIKVFECFVKLTVLALGNFEYPFHFFSLGVPSSWNIFDNWSISPFPGRLRNVCERHPFGRLSYSPDPLEVEIDSPASFEDPRPFAGRSRRTGHLNFCIGSTPVNSQLRSLERLYSYSR